MTDKVHIRLATSDECAVYDWPTEGLALRLVRAMRDSYPTVINTCRDCLSRAGEDAAAKLNSAIIRLREDNLKHDPQPEATCEPTDK